VAKPLPVDVTSTWWDYVVDVADILAGLGTAGALLIAAFVYRRQVDESFRQQATKVVIYEVETPSELVTLKTSFVENRSDQPVLLASAHVLGPGAHGAVEWDFTPEDAPCVLFAYDRMKLYDVANFMAPYTLIRFHDAGGRLWERDITGGLARMHQRFFDRARKRRYIKRKSHGRD
jgi:hypothetical protein